MDVADHATCINQFEFQQQSSPMGVFQLIWVRAHTLKCQLAPRDIAHAKLLPAILQCDDFAA